LRGATISGDQEKEAAAPRPGRPQKTMVYPTEGRLDAPGW
jgi:hypothetical protein